MQEQNLTIAGAARGAGVGVETIRYYERRGLVQQPDRELGSVRRYRAAHVNRIRFIKRAQELGFTLDEIKSLLALEDGVDRRRIREISTQRLEETRRRIADLRRMEHALAHVLRECESHGKALRCPIIAVLAGGGA